MDPLAGVPWFPQDYAALFYVIKGALSLVATVLLLSHMREVRREEITTGRWLRYLVLLYFAVLLTGASLEQVGDEAIVSYRNLGGLLGSVALIVAVVVSITETRDHR
jgi:hypothetical protein